YPGATLYSNGTQTFQIGQPSSFVWVDDSLPTGATPASDGGDSWNWVSASPAPYSGSEAAQSNIATGEHQHYFTGATQMMQVNAGDTLFAYVYIDPANKPSELMLQWNVGGSWEHRAYWGANSISWGDNGSLTNPAHFFVGAIPSAGGWWRLEVPASAVGLGGQTVSGMAFTLYGGGARPGPHGKTPPRAVPPLVRDAAPARGGDRGDTGDVE